MGGWHAWARPHVTQHGGSRPSPPRLQAGALLLIGCMDAQQSTAALPPASAASAAGLAAAAVGNMPAAATGSAAALPPVAPVLTLADVAGPAGQVTAMPTTAMPPTAASAAPLPPTAPPMPPPAAAAVPPQQQEGITAQDWMALPEHCIASIARGLGSCASEISRVQVLALKYLGLALSAWQLGPRFHACAIPSTCTSGGLMYSKNGKHHTHPLSTRPTFHPPHESTLWTAPHVSRPF